MAHCSLGNRSLNGHLVQAQIKFCSAVKEGGVKNGTYILNTPHDLLQHVFFLFNSVLFSIEQCSVFAILFFYLMLLI